MAGEKQLLRLRPFLYISVENGFNAEILRYDQNDNHGNLPYY